MGFENNDQWNEQEIMFKIKSKRTSITQIVMRDVCGARNVTLCEEFGKTGIHEPKRGFAPFAHKKAKMIHLIDAFHLNTGHFQRRFQDR